MTKKEFIEKVTNMHAWKDTCVIIAAAIANGFDPEPPVVDDLDREVEAGDILVWLPSHQYLVTTRPGVLSLVEIHNGQHFLSSQIQYDTENNPHSLRSLGIKKPGARIIRRADRTDEFAKGKS